jgi:Protein of unknown function (DUF2442)
MNKIISFKVQDDYQILLQFQDGESKVIDFKQLIGKGISSLLLDKNYFNQVSIDNGGGLEWPNGMDFCPNFLKDYTPDFVNQV